MNQPPVPNAVCPHCGEGADGATERFGDRVVPKPGDVSVCAYCAGIGEYHDADGRLAIRPLDLAKLTDSERGELLAVQRMIAGASR